MRAFESLLHDATTRLKEAGVVRYVEDARAIFDDVFLGDAELFGDPARQRCFHELVEARARREPLGYVLGHANLGEVRVAVGRGVFVPRRQTERVVAWAVSTLDGTDRPLVVDLCTGAAATALLVAERKGDADVIAVDVDEVALSWAQRNVRRAGVEHRVRLRRADVCDASAFPDLVGRVDLVVANPPFVTDGTVQPPEWGVHQPARAVYGGVDGLHVIRGVLQSAELLLSPGRALALEHAPGQGPAIAALLQASGAFDDVTERSVPEDNCYFTTAMKTGAMTDATPPT